MAFPGDQISLTISSDGPARFGAAGRFLAVEGIFINGSVYKREGFLRLRESKATSRALLMKAGDVVMLGDTTDLVADLEGDTLAPDETMTVRARIYDRPEHAPRLTGRTLDRSQVSTSVLTQTIEKTGLNKDVSVLYKVAPFTAGVPSKSLVVQAADIQLASGEAYDLKAALSSRSKILAVTSAPPPTIASETGISAETYTSAQINELCRGLFPLAVSYDETLIFEVTPASDGTDIALSYTAYTT
jgi:hypothetical protein